MKNNPASDHWDGRIWSGVFRTFAEATCNGNVFDDAVWLRMQQARAMSAIEHRASSSAIAEVAQTKEYVLPAVAAAIAQSHETLKILDFGGGLGSSYLPLTAMLPAAQDLQFVVVENKSLCEEGRRVFEGERQLSFRTEVPVSEKFDIIHAGSSFHYVDDWLAVLRRFAQLQPQYIIFADLPAGDIDTFVTIQNYYGRTIPVRFWNLVEFVAAVEALGFRLVMKSRYHSEYLVAMNGFDPMHRLNHFSQLIFRRTI